MYFVGIDLGWQSGGSGVCLLQAECAGLRLLSFHHCDSRAAVLALLDQLLGPTAPALIAVDAPTLIPNETGMRECDRLAHRYFGKYDAGCYPANRGRPFATALLDFGLALEARGFYHAPQIVPQQPGRYQIELFPHPATIHLFRLAKILKYKKGAHCRAPTSPCTTPQPPANYLPDPHASAVVAGRRPPDFAHWR